MNKLFSNVSVEDITPDEPVVGGIAVEDVVEAETITLEIAADMHDIETDFASMEAGNEACDSLTAQVGIESAILADENTVPTESIVAMSVASLEATALTLGFPTSHFKISTEARSETPGIALKISVEEKQDMITKILFKIKEIFLKVMNAIKKTTLKILTAVDKSEKVLGALKTKLGEQTELKDGAKLKDGDIKNIKYKFGVHLASAGDLSTVGNKHDGDIKKINAMGKKILKDFTEYGDDVTGVNIVDANGTSVTLSVMSKKDVSIGGKDGDTEEFSAIKIDKYLLIPKITDKAKVEVIKHADLVSLVVDTTKRAKDFSGRSKEGIKRLDDLDKSIKNTEKDAKSDDFGKKEGRSEAGVAEFKKLTIANLRNKSINGPKAIIGQLLADLTDIKNIIWLVNVNTGLYEAKK